MLCCYQGQAIQAKHPSRKFFIKMATTTWSQRDLLWKDPMSNNLTLTISSVNMRKHNVVTHVLLNHTSHSHLILLQEPWYDRIGTTRQDDAHEGVDIYSGVASPAWDIHYPNSKPGQHPKVMAYTHKTISPSSNELVPFSVISCLESWTYVLTHTYRSLTLYMWEKNGG
jgi:hypothetical protein